LCSFTHFREYDFPLMQGDEPEEHRDLYVSIAEWNGLLETDEAKISLQEDRKQRC
jgi:hypothetical protein